MFNHATKRAIHQPPHKLIRNGDHPQQCETAPHLASRDFAQVLLADRAASLVIVTLDEAALAAASPLVRLAGAHHAIVGWDLTACTLLS